LHDFLTRPAIEGSLAARAMGVRPNDTLNGSRAIVPGDFATIYNVKPLYNNNINGTGQTIAIVGRSNININDVRLFRSEFGLPAKDPVILPAGTTAKDTGGGDELEADLDVEWSGAVARNATIDFVVINSTNSTDGAVLSAQYIVTNKIAPIMSMSFGECESFNGYSPVAGETPLQFFYNLWGQAVTHGMTVFVSAGDSGAAGCDPPLSTEGTSRAVSAFCSTPYNVCVGGSEFDDTSNPGLWWSSTPNQADQSTALSYIPESAWNESGDVSGGSGLWATGGGASTKWPKPPWQVAPGVPPDKARDVPDVALSAAKHDGYVVVQGGVTILWWTLFSTTEAVGGTSAAAPSFAGLMALVEQKNGQWQGNANTVLYPMAQSQYGFGSPVVFHDITAGNNTVPGVAGYSAGTGYDQVTGLGSVDANALVNDWGGPRISAFSVSPGSLVLGEPFTISATVSNIGGSSLSEIQVWRAPNSGGSPGTWAQVNSTSLSGDGPTSISLDDTPPSTGSYWYGAHACNEGNSSGG
jgi:subtilase family serine protease